MKKAQTIFWQITITVIVLMMLTSITYTWLSGYTAKLYFHQANQLLSADLAQSIANEKPPFDEDGNVNMTESGIFFHNTMTHNPAIEIYLLDPKGKVLSYSAPQGKVKLKTLALDPLKKYITTKGRVFVKGDDPRNPGEEKVFSAAEIKDGDKLKGYIYVILASEEYDAIINQLLNTYILRIGAVSMLLTIIYSIVVAIMAWTITRNLERMIEIVKSFKEGNYKNRIDVSDVKTAGGLKILGETFNEMADTIVSNIHQMKLNENLRRELIANVSHDLRTPLAVIHGYLETLTMKENLAQDKQQEYIKIALEGNEKLKKLIHSLFEYSKLETIQQNPTQSPFFMNELAFDVFHKYQILCQQKNIEFIPVIGQDLPMVFADIAMIDRVLQNLIENAIKFTPDKGTITLKTMLLDKQVLVEVSDTGIGIAAEELPYIFDRYRKSASSEGGGLGLAIVKKMLLLNDSDITVKSRIGEGSTFSFLLRTYESNK